MAVDQPKVIDAIGVDRVSGELVLTISDHLEWSEHCNEHLLALQDKLNAYLGFVESGEVLATYPEAAGRRVMIDVVCKYAPNAQAIKFLNAASTAASEAGVALRYGTLQDA